MKSSGFIKRFVFTALLSLGAVNGVFAQSALNQVLIGGTDFDPINPTEERAFIGIDEIKMTGVLGGTLEVYGTQPSTADDLDYDYSKQTANKGERIKSHFHDGEFMAITGNPIQLDSLHYIDDKKEDWGVVWSRFSGTANKTILSYRVSGLKPNSSVKVIIKYRSVIDPDADAYDKLKCSQTGSQQTAIKVAENPDQYNLTAGQDATQIMHGESGTYDNSKVMGAQASAGRADDEGSFFLNVNMTSEYMGQNCASLEITSIEVYGTIDPQIYSEEGETVCAGEIANVKLKGVFEGAKYQWYDGSTPIAGATAPNYSFETTSAEYTYNLQLQVSYEGTAFKSNRLTIKTEKCCEIINEAGDIVSASRKIVFKDDFGEFDLSDKTGKTYKVWDYSDIANPVQITKRTTTPFRYELDYAPLGCTFQGEGPVLDGEYTVAGVLTEYAPYYGLEGAHLEWAGDLHGKKRTSGIHFDHSGKPEGCCLLINCKGNTAGQNIYEREITNLCQNRELTFECYITIFSSEVPGSYNPVDVTLRATEIGNSTNVVEKSATQTRPADGGTGNWVKISGKIYLEKGDGIKLEIVNNVNPDQNGNDLVIDDIIVRACAAPSLQAYFDSISSTSATTCDGNDISIYAKPTEMLTNYFGSTNTRFLYQWTLTPDNKKSWKNIGDPTDESEMKAGSSPFAGLLTDDKVYFRVIAGSDYTLSTTPPDFYNVDDPYAAYSISDILECRIECPTCTEPIGHIKITADSTIGKITLNASVDKNIESPIYHWLLNGDKPLLRGGSGPVILDYDDININKGVVTVYAVDINGCKTDTATFKFELAPYCIDGEGNRENKILVWQEDFGEFDFSDSTGKTYKVWDYSDLTNPVQVTKKTQTPFRYELDYTPLGCTFQGKGPLEDGKYTVAGVLTTYTPYEGMDGAKLEWAGDLHGVKLNSGIHYDHSGTPEGCCLFVNCKDQTADQDIYKREISNLCENKLYAFECYISIFTSEANGKYNPVDVTLRATEIGNTTNVIEKRATQTKPADGGTGNWVKLSGEIVLEKGDGIKLELINNVDTDQNGNDLVVDDIRIFTCGYCNPTNIETIVANDDEIVNVYTVSGALVKSNVKKSEALKGLSNGSYIVGDQKVIVK